MIMSKMLKFVNGAMIEYEVFKLVDIYDPILRTPTVPFDFNQYEAWREAEYLAYSLAETCGRLDGLGLSANQCGINKRVCVINMGEKIWTMFNPQIIERSPLLSNFSEGCLSYPGLYVKVPNRSASVKVRFQAIGGQFVEQKLEGISAICVQHEIDHLDGIMFTDKVGKIKLEQAKSKVKQNLKKMARVTQEQAEKAALALQKSGRV
jgi:peptide deformylase